MRKYSDISLLKQAKEFRNDEKRRWIRAGYADSYGEEQNRVIFWVLEGSPPRGFIIQKPGICVRLDASCRVIKRFMRDH
jgi:hypothetical protein